MIQGAGISGWVQRLVPRHQGFGHGRVWYLDPRESWQIEGLEIRVWIQSSEFSVFGIRNSVHGRPSIHGHTVYMGLDSASRTRPTPPSHASEKGGTGRDQSSSTRSPHLMGWTGHETPAHPDASDVSVKRYRTPCIPNDRELRDGWSEAEALATSNWGFKRLGTVF